MSQGKPTPVNRVNCATRGAASRRHSRESGNPVVGRALPKACGVDSRFRGNDSRFLRRANSNDATTFVHVREVPNGQAIWIARRGLEL